jgi:L-ascorbate metabolism protein UlaG (beta-lactamase superfamily)
MIISYQGIESLKIQFGDTVVAYNPISKDSSFKSSKFGADIVLVSCLHKDFNGVENASRGDREPFAVMGPGEYEIGGVFIRGFLSKSNYDGEERLNTIYLMNLENMNLCFLGALGQVDSIDSDTKEALDDVDILFVPIGGNGVLDPAEAYKMAVKLEPKIIIPIHYGDELNKNALKTFLKEGGEESVKPVDKLTVKKKDLEGKEGDIVVLSATSS